MSNTLLTNSILTKKPLALLSNNYVALRAVNRQYDSQFASTGGKIGDTLSVRLPERVLTSRGAALQVRDAEQRSVPVTVTEQYQASVNFASAELALKMDDFEERVLAPRMEQLASDMDVQVLSNYWRIPTTVGTPGTSPAGTNVLLQAMERFRQEGYGNSPKISLLLNPTANTTLIPALQGLFNPVDKLTRQFNSGLFAENVLGYKEISVTASLPNHVCGSFPASGITVSSTVTTEGANQITLAFSSGTYTFNRGDVFTIAGVNSVNPLTRTSTGVLRQFSVQSTTTVTSGTTITLTVFPEMTSAAGTYSTVTALPQSGAAVTMIGAPSTAYQQSLALHEDALYFVTADLALPQNVEFAKRENYKGVSMRIVKNYDINNDTHPLRFDILAGDGSLRPLGAVRIWGAQA
jgi:hypothetical protein